MRRALLLASAAAGALVLAAPGLAAYRPQLVVTPQGPLSPAGHQLRFAQARTDDATARLEIAVPTAYRVMLGQRPGTVLGTASAEVTVRGFDVGAIPVGGRTVVAVPEEYAAAAVACGVGTVTAVWRVELSAPTGQTIALTVFVDAGGALVRLVACLPSPDVPEEQGGAPFGVKLVSASLTLAGVLASPTERGRHVWSARLAPYAAGTATRGAAVEARAVVPVPSRVTLARRVVRGTAVALTGRLLEAGAGVSGVRVELWEARNARGTGARRVVRGRTARTGAFSFRRSPARPRWYAVVVQPRVVTGRECRGSTAPGGCVSATVAPAASRLLRAAVPARRRR